VFYARRDEVDKQRQTHIRLKMILRKFKEIVKQNGEDLDIRIKRQIPLGLTFVSNSIHNNAEEKAKE
jgi:ApbE superfamily uncharacterized protein (UPF0280 family)